MTPVPMRMRMQTVTAKVRRLSLSTAGTVAIAGSNFLLSLTLIPLLSPQDYGFFTFGQVLTTFSYSIVNAMGGTPLSITMNRAGEDWRPEYLAIMKVNALLALLAGGIALASGVLFDMPLLVTVLMGIFTMSAALRWGVRCAEFARHRLKTTAASDLIYAVTIVLGCAVVHLSDRSISLVLASGVVALAAGLSALYLWLTLEKVHGDSRISRYGRVWRAQARWALIGVVTTEMTSNGHAYLVTFLAGPQAFAPIAVATLFWRPMSVVLPSLMLVERPVMARHISNGNLSAARQTARSFLQVVLVLLAGNVLVAATIAVVFHGKVASLPYDPMTLYVASGLWFVVVLIQSVRIPASCLVQAANLFKPLARTSVFAAPVTMPVAAAVILLVSPIASIIGIIAGEIVMTALVLRLARSGLSLGDQAPKSA